MFARDDLVCGLDDRLGDIVLDELEVAIGLCGGLLDDTERADESPAERDSRNGEVLDGALGLCAPVGVFRYLHLTEAVLLESVIVISHTRRDSVGQVKGTETVDSWNGTIA